MDRIKFFEQVGIFSIKEYGEDEVAEWAFLFWTADEPKRLMVADYDR